MHLFTCLFSSLYHYLRLVPEFSCQYWHLISKGWIIQAFFKKLISFSSFFTFQVHVKPLKNMPKETSMQLLRNLTINEKKLTTTELNNNAEIFINAQICIITRSLHFVQNDGGGKKWRFVFPSSANFNNTIWISTHEIEVTCMCTLRRVHNHDSHSCRL